MSRINEIIESAVNNVKGNKSGFDVEKWAQEKNEKRKWAYKTQDEMSRKIIENVDFYKAYLDIQSKFTNYSVGNTLLIMAQNSKAAQLKDVEGWKRDNINFARKPTPIIILEPSNIYEREDGMDVQGYDTKKVYDISDMKVKRKINTISYTSENIMRAILSIAPVQVEVIKNTVNDKLVNYNANRRIIEVSEKAEVEEIIQGLIREIASIKLLTFKQSELNNFKNESISYMISKRYGLPTNNYSFEKIPEELKQMTPKEIKSELGKSVECAEIIIDDMSKYIETHLKNKINKEYER